MAAFFQYPAGAIGYFSFFDEPSPLPRALGQPGRAVRLRDASERRRKRGTCRERRARHRRCRRPSSLIWPEDCAARWQYRCDSYAPLSGCTCDESIPEDIDECGGYGALYCNEYLTGPSPAWVDCSCHSGAPRGPEDRLTSADFVCDHRPAESPPEQCRCEAQRPDAPEDCEIPERFQCVQYAPRFVECWCDESDNHPESACHGYYLCASEEPRYGCVCEPPR